MGRLYEYVYTYFPRYMYSTTGDPIRATNEGPVTKWDRLRYSFAGQKIQGFLQKIQGFFRNYFGGGAKLNKQALAALGVCCSVCYSVCCSVLQCVAVCCSVLQCVAV